MALLYWDLVNVKKATPAFYKASESVSEGPSSGKIKVLDP